MSSANVTISSTIKTRDQGFKQANAAFHGDERMLNVLLRTLVAQDRFIASQITLGGVNCGVVAAGTGSQTITVGFQPAYVKAFAYSGTVITSTAEIYSGMPLSSAILTSGGGTAMSQSVITSGGFTINSTGFKGGVKVFVPGVRINYMAMRRLGS